MYRLITPLFCGFPHDINDWDVKYNPEEVRNFLQSRGLRNQDIDRTPLAKELLAGLLPEIFGPVFESGAFPESGYPCHDGVIIDSSRPEVIVVYTHGQNWDHYHTDPIKQGLSGASFALKLMGHTGQALKLSPYKVPIDVLVELILGEQLSPVLEANPPLKFCQFPSQSRYLMDVNWRMFSYHSVHQLTDESYLEMHVMDPTYPCVTHACDIYRRVVEVIRANETAFTQFAKGRTDSALKELFAPVREEVAAYFSQPIFSRMPQ